MKAKRHPELKNRLGMKPPPVASVHTLADGQPEQAPIQKPPPLAAWHYDPQLFRKWPQVAEDRGAGEQYADREEEKQVSLGL
jgi:hypothetical protein